MGLIACMENADGPLAEFDDDDFDAVEMLVSDTEQALADTASGMDQDVRVLETALNIYTDYKEKRITEDQFRYSVFAVESAVFGPNSNMQVIATEGIVGELGKAIGNLFQRVYEGTKNLADHLQYAWKLFTLQRGRIRSLRAKLDRTQTPQVTIRVGITKYLCYGEMERPAEDFKAYFEQFKLLNEVLTPFISTIEKLTDEDLFSSLKWFKEATIGELEDFFNDRFESLERNLGGLGTRLANRQSKSTALYTEYKSPVMLGCATVMVRVPKANTYKRGDFETQYSTHRFFYAHVHRLTKVRLTTLVDGKVEMTVNKRELQQILLMAEALLEEATPLLSYGVRLSEFGSLIQASSVKKRSAEEGFDIRGFYKSVQIYTRISSIIYDSVSSSFTLALGNVKTAARIGELALKKMA